MNMEVTKRIEFECCYIYHYTVQAHRYRLEVTVEGPQRFDDHGTVITFDDLQKYMKRAVPDNKFIYHVEDYPGVHVGKAFVEVGCDSQPYEFSISAENLCKHIAESLQNTFDLYEPGIKILELKLREDSNSFVSWKRESC